MGKKRGRNLRVWIWKNNSLVKYSHNHAVCVTHRKLPYRALKQLYDRERDILKMFFGIGCQEMTLEEIGAKFDLTRERVRQIKEKAIRRLKGQKSKLLKSYLGE